MSERFRESLAKFCGLTWRRHQFEGEDRPLTKTGNAYLRYYMVEAANSVRTSCPEFGSYYDMKLFPRLPGKARWPASACSVCSKLPLDIPPQLSYSPTRGSILRNPHAKFCIDRRPSGLAEITVRLREAMHRTREFAESDTNARSYMRSGQAPRKIDPTTFYKARPALLVARDKEFGVVPGPVGTRCPQGLLVRD